MQARLSNARISPKKMNLVAGVIRGKNALEAQTALTFTDKKASAVLLKLLNSAMANAVHNFKQDPAQLVIDEIKVTQGQSYRRFRPVSRGRAHPVVKRNCHVIITLKATPKEKAAEAKAKATTSSKAKAN